MPYHRSWLFVFLLLFGAVVVVNPPAFPQKTDILIIAPHPDDAVLCCAGVIQQARARGKTVRVVNVTDGDGYKDAAAALFGKKEAALTTADMRKFGRIRRREELQALAVLGVKRNQVTFLGYPDGWLNEVYEHTETAPLPSPYTGKSRTDTGKNFSRGALQNDIRMLLHSPAPKELYVPSGHDDALDHRVIYRVIMDALNDVGYTGKLSSYFTHKKQNDAEKYLATSTIVLTDNELAQKFHAIVQYRSQHVPDDTFLRSFASPYEVFY